MSHHRYRPGRKDWEHFGLVHVCNPMVLTFPFVLKQGLEHTKKLTKTKENETWSGRYMSRHRYRPGREYKKQVDLHVCNTTVPTFPSKSRLLTCEKTKKKTDEKQKKKRNSVGGAQEDNGGQSHDPLYKERKYRCVTCRECDTLRPRKACVCVCVSSSHYIRTNPSIRPGLNLC